MVPYYRQFQNMLSYFFMFYGWNTIVKSVILLNPNILLKCHTVKTS